MDISTSPTNKDLIKIKENLQSNSRYYTDSALVIQGDSLMLMEKIPDASISLVLTDPPYHCTKKKNIHGDTSFKSDDIYLEWLYSLAKQWKRILRKNGSLYLFCASKMAARIEVMLSKDFNILSSIVWNKPDDPGFDGWKGKMNKSTLRRWYPNSERILFAEPKLCDECLSPFGHLLKESRTKIGMSAKQLAEEIGAYGRVNHGGSVCNWETGRSIPSKSQYEKICSAISAKSKLTMPSYEWLKSGYARVIRPFNVDRNFPYTDVWNFPTVHPYKGKHPAEKPSDVLEHIIRTSSLKQDIVLDCFGGSGSTLLSSIKLERLGVCIEIDSDWIDVICNRVKDIKPS